MNSQAEKPQWPTTTQSEAVKLLNSFLDFQVKSEMFSKESLILTRTEIRLISPLDSGEKSFLDATINYLNYLITEYVE